MNLREILISLGKEWTDARRDVKTLCLMFGVPILLSPLSILAPIWAMALPMQSVHHTTRVVVLAPEQPKFIEYLQRDQQLRLLPAAAARTAGEMITAGYCDAVIVVPPRLDADVAAGGAPMLKIYQSATTPYIFDIKNVIRALDVWEADVRAKRLRELGVANDIIVPVTLKVDSIETEKERTSYWMAFLCTMLVGLTMTCSSTYPALDALTGERERGTLVLLLMAPGDRKNIVAAKLLLVTLLTLLSAVISIASISVSILLAPPPPVDGVPIHLTVPLWNLLAASVFLPPIALSISACGLMVSSYAKTFQQGQSYFLPFVLLAMILTGLVLVVDQSAPFFINFVPIANLLLCLHKAIQGRWDALSIAATCVASSVFIGLLLHAAVGILDSEETLFGVKQPPGRRTSYI